MLLNMDTYTKMLNDLGINIIYSGPMWDDGIIGLSEMVKVHLSKDSVSENSARAIFSVFVEQVTNMLMYSVEKGLCSKTEKPVSIGMLVLGRKEGAFFIQTRNAIKNENVELIKGRIDHLNTLDKKELRRYHKQKLNEENDNPESQGAGLGLIEIARRATKPIGYTFKQIGDELSAFTMYAEIAQEVE